MRIKNWQQFQHFKDRTPPWVKLYRDLLDDPDWHALDGDSAKALTMLWLIASEDKTMQGCLPDLPRLAFRLRVSMEEVKRVIGNLSPWLEDVDNSALSACHQVDNKMLSARYQLDAPETETETEEREMPLPSAPASALTPEEGPAIREKATSGGTRLSSEMDLPEAWIEEAQRIRPVFSRQTIREIFEEFRDYWTARPGKDGRKADWLATWRNWVRREKTREEKPVEKEDWDWI